MKNYTDTFSHRDLAALAYEIDTRRVVPLKYAYKTAEGAELCRKLEDGSGWGKDVEGSLLREIVTPLLQRLKEGTRQKIIRLIDFGCGSGKTTSHAVKTLQAAGYIPILYPLDISKKMHGYYAAFMQERFPGIEIHPHEVDFDEKNEIFDFLRELEITTKDSRTELVGLFTGNTIGNSNSARLLENIIGSLNADDKLILGVHRSDVTNPAWIKSVTEGYQTKDVTDFEFSTLAHFGVRQDQGEIKTRFNRKKSAIERHFVPSQALDIAINGKTVHLESGTSIQFVQSDKINEAGLGRLLEKLPVHQDLIITSPCRTQMEVMLTRHRG